MTTTYGVLGVGSIATAIVTGLCDGVADPPTVLLSPRNAATAARLARRYASVTIAPDNQAVVDGSDVVLLCLRQRDANVLDGLDWRPEQAVVSPMPGLSVPDLIERCTPVRSAARAIAMPALATRSAATVVHPPTPAARELFDRLGGTIEVADASAYDALYTASATVAPFFAYLDTLVGWLVSRGVDHDAATAHLVNVFTGVLAPLADVTDPDFGELAAEHATPGGVNEQVTSLLREAGVYDAVRDAIDTVHQRLNPA